MRAGNLDRSIVIQRRFFPEVSDAGSTTAVWADIATVRAELLAPAMVTATSAAPTAFNTVESDRAYGGAEEAVLTFRLRYLDGITTANRVRYSGAQYDITGITEIGRRRGLLIRCRLVS